MSELDEKISFKKKIVLKDQLESFNPYIELKIEEKDITNFFNDYRGGETLILDLSELYFIDMNRVYKKELEGIKGVLEDNNRPRIHGSLRFKNNSKGSVPIVLEWN